MVSDPFLVPAFGRTGLTPRRALTAGDGPSIIALHSKLKGPVKRLGAPRAPIACAPNLDDQVGVAPEQIVEAACAMLRS